jgi:zinc transport system ATP-binding protein
MTPDPAVEIENLSHSYNGVTVLKNLNITIPDYDFLCIVGQNGGGKTTLLKLMAGLIPCQTGNVKLFGKNAFLFHSDIGYVSQHQFYDSLFPITTQEIVNQGRISAKKSGMFFLNKTDKNIINETMEMLRITPFSKKPFFSLSGGQRQRTLIARAICSKPNILFLDEATSNLDPGTESLLMDILSQINKKITIVMVSHHLQIASEYVKRVLCLNITAEFRDFIKSPNQGPYFKGHDYIYKINHKDECLKRNHDV